MKGFYTIFFSTVLAGSVFAENAKINQYASLSDCKSDINIISHAAPGDGDCHTVDSRTRAIFLTGSIGAFDAYYAGFTDKQCGSGGSKVMSDSFELGKCINTPDGLVSLDYEVA